MNTQIEGSLTIAIVGSRKYPKPAFVRDFVRQLPKGVDIISGGAKGVDSVAEFSARHYGHPVTVFAAEWERWGKSAGYIRNEYIVDAADFVVAFWDGESNGTDHTINLAKKRGVPHYVFGPESDGSFAEVLRLLYEESMRRAYVR